MKDWQHGIDLERLKAIAATYERHNAFALSPFAQFKKNDIAEAIHRNEFIELDGASYCFKRVQRDSKVTMFQDVVIARPRAGDRLITRANWQTAHARLRLLNAIRRHRQEHDLWLQIFEEDAESRSFARMAGFKKIGTKFTSFAEIIGVYFQPTRACSMARMFAEDALTLRKMPVPESELLTLERLRCDPLTAVSEREIEAVLASHTFTNHYSNYNKGKSWSALALRGYSDDIGCIIKPSEMPEKWKVDNVSKTWRLQWTPLMNAFSGMLRQSLGRLCESEEQLQRVRLMKLAPKGGELQRHTDQVDKESGTRAGQFLRIHLPVVTNDQVLFTAWDCDGAERTLNMKVGEAYYLDTRKPHRAINGGETDRIHLVVDVQANAKLLAMLS